MDKFNERASGSDMDRLVSFLQRAMNGQVSEAGMEKAGFDIKNPAGNNETVITPKMAIALGLRIELEDMQMAMAELRIKSLGEVVVSWLKKTGNQMYNPVEGIRESEERLFAQVLTESKKNE